MSRTLTAGVTTAIADHNIRAAVLVHFAFDSGATRFWSGIGDLVYNGDTFTGAGNLGSVGIIEETSEIKATGLTFTISGIPSALIATALDEDYQGRACTCWVAYFDANWALIADPVQVFSGRMDIMYITDAGDKAQITIAVENRLIDLERPNNVLYMTDSDQRALCPGDKGLEFVNSMQEAVFIWGRATLTPGKGDSGAGTPASGGVVSGSDFDNSGAGPEVFGGGSDNDGTTGGSVDDFAPRNDGP